MSDKLTGRQLLEFLQRRTPQELERPIKLSIKDFRGRQAWATSYCDVHSGMFVNDDMIWIAGHLTDMRLLPEINR